jgi:hypothetical protein
MNELLARVERIGPCLGRWVGELRLAIGYIQEDPGSSLTKSRIVLEQLLEEIFTRETGHKPPEKLFLNGLLERNELKQKIERRIFVRFKSICESGNLGAHGEKVAPQDATRIVHDLCDVLDWYAETYHHETRAFAIARNLNLPCNLPDPLGTLFKGREDYLQMIHAKFLEAHSHGDRASGSHVTSSRKAIHGQGGVGKTRLAVEYAWRYRGEYTAMLFVPADSKTNLRRNLANLTGPFVLNLSSCKDRPEEDQMAQALAWLKDHPGWFLILDNVDTEEAAAAVGEVLPQLHGGDVLITSRLRHWKPGVEKLELDVLKTADAQSLFRDLLKHQSPQRLLDSEADVDSLLRELDGLAVSIEHAAAYIACVGCSIAEFRRRLRIRDEHVREWHDPAVMVYSFTSGMTMVGLKSYCVSSWKKTLSFRVTFVTWRAY